MDSLHRDSQTGKRIWQDFIAHFKSETTIHSYLSDISECCDYLGKCFEEFSRHDVEKYFNWLQQRVKDEELKPATMAKKFRECHSLAQYISENISKYEVNSEFQDYFYPLLMKVAKQEKFAKSIPIEEIDRLLLAAQTEVMAYTIFILLYRIGLSTTELVDIKWNDLGEYSDGVYVWIEKRKEALYLPEDVVLVLNAYLKGKEVTDYLFTNKWGGVLNTMYISRLMKKYTALAGIPSYSAEALRNSCAFTLYAYGAKDKHVAKQLGTTVMQIKRYDDLRYKDQIQKQAHDLVKLRVEPPV